MTEPAAARVDRAVATRLDLAMSLPTHGGDDEHVPLQGTLDGRLVPVRVDTGDDDFDAAFQPRAVEPVRARALLADAGVRAARASGRVPIAAALAPHEAGWRAVAAAHGLAMTTCLLATRGAVAGGRLEPASPGGRVDPSRDTRCRSCSRSIRRRRRSPMTTSASASARAPRPPPPPGSPASASRATCSDRMVTASHRGLPTADHVAQILARVLAIARDVRSRWAAAGI